jgi:hypothetical protein
LIYRGLFYTLTCVNRGESRLPESPFSLAEARDICIAPYLAREQRREAVGAAQAEAEARRSAGVCWSGLGAGPSRPVRTAKEVRAAAEAALARAADFAESPRGQFLLALRRLESLGYAAQTEAARAAFARGFADPDRPACPAEIGAALGALARIEQPDARQACLALAELLSGALGMAAE